MKDNEEFLKSRKLATVAWAYASVVFVALVVLGVFATDTVRDANGARLPVVPVVLFTLVVLALMRKYFQGLEKKRSSK